MKINRKYIYLGLLCLALVLGGSFCDAASYDIYVDASADDEDEDGSQENPYVELEDAIEEAESNGRGSRKIYVKKGEYDEKITLGNYVELHGENNDNVIITGKVTMDDNSSIKNVTVKSSGIYVLSGADIKIENCEIKNSSIGVNAEPGSGKVQIEDSKFSGNKKGIYIQQGREVEIVGNNIDDNREEGLDIRAKVEGIIKSNTFFSNSESGIELIVGSSNLVISGNSMRSNGSSGVATQFYSETKKLGKVKISGNTVRKNNKYGIDCNMPSGGKPALDYWQESIELSGNKISDNQIADINNFCNLSIDSSETSEKEKNEIGKTPDEEIKKTEEEVKKEEAERIRIERLNEKIRARAEELKSEINFSQGWANESIGEAQRSNYLVVFYFGPAMGVIKSAEYEIGENQKRIAELREIEQESTNEEDKAYMQSIISEGEQSIEQQRILIEKEKARPSSLTFLKNLFGWT